ncbi:hypothetical protein [Lactobacillus helveticus]|uniref:hypothetical protein n=1 Tax=Lactobacillus helveticus TaxID=1587 RepID=UPI001561D749|nr:hypothetical protein [Lactobacillus helveticus]NRN98613.1 hypothetical protein [Lactobacillus helveticus]
MTAKKNFNKKKINKNRKELTPKAKKAAVGTASVLLGASLMGNAKPIKKIVGGKREDDISLVVKADTIEGTEESSDVITSAGQEDQVAETETMPVEEETTVNDDTQTSAVAEQVDDEVNLKMIQLLLRQMLYLLVMVKLKLKRQKPILL